MGIGLLAAGLLVLLAGLAQADPPEAASLEYRLKTAFIYNFTRFVEWPPEGVTDPAAPFRIGVLGVGALGEEISALRGKMVNGRPLSIRHYPVWNDEVRECEILFIAASEANYLHAILAKLDDAPVLTLGDTESFAARGIMINFFMESNKVRFEINLKQARAAGLEISSRLLKLAVLTE
jgi:hypothetical protein